MNILNWINQGIDNLTNISGPGMEALGFHIFVALLTTMMVWFGVQEALSSAQGGPGFNFARFVDFVVVASFAYTFIEFYSNAIPGVGYSFKDFINVGASDLANIIGHDGIDQMYQTIADMQNQLGAGIVKAMMNT